MAKRFKTWKSQDKQIEIVTTQAVSEASEPVGVQVMLADDPAPVSKIEIVPANAPVPKPEPEKDGPETNIGAELTKAMDDAIQAKAEQEAEEAKHAKPVILDQRDMYRRAKLKQIEIEEAQERAHLAMTNQLQRAATPQERMGRSVMQTVIRQAETEPHRVTATGADEYPDIPDMTEKARRTAANEYLPGDAPNVVVDARGADLPLESDTMRNAALREHEIKMSSEGKLGQAQENIRRLFDLRRKRG